MLGKKILGILSCCLGLNCADALQRDLVEEGARLHNKLSAVLANLSPQDCQDILAKIRGKTFPDYSRFQAAGDLIGIIGDNDWSEVVNPQLSYAFDGLIVVPLQRYVHAAQRSGNGVSRHNINCLIITQRDGQISDIKFEVRTQKQKKSQDKSRPELRIGGLKYGKEKKHF